MTGSPGLAPWLLHKRPLKSGLYKVSDPTNEVRGFSPKREQRFPPPARTESSPRAVPTTAILQPIVHRVRAETAQHGKGIIIWGRIGRTLFVESAGEKRSPGCLAAWASFFASIQSCNLV